MKILKNCLKCGSPFITSWYSERSKFCSRNHMYLYKRTQRKLKEREIRKQRTIVRTKKKLALKRQQELNRITLLNKKTVFEKNGNGTHKFGDTILTLKNYKEPLKEIEKKKGFGYYGTLAVTLDGEGVQCHLCGRFLGSLPFHIWKHHKIKTKEYRQKFELSPSTALVSENVRLKLKEDMIKMLAAQTPEERVAYRKLSRERLKEMRSKRSNLQPKITLETKNKRGTCPDQLLEKLRDVAATLGHTPSSKEFVDFCETQRYKHLIFATFGSWNNAVRMAKLNPKPREKGRYIKYTDEELLESLRIFAEENRKVPTYTDFKRGLLPTYETYIRRWKTIETARQEAGVYEFID